MPSNKLYTSTEVGDLLQVTASSVVKWVDAGLITAYTTPGGHRRIRIPDLLVFLRKHGMYIPPELQDAKRKVLFVDDDANQLKEMRRGMKPFAERVELLTAESAAEALLLVGLHRPDLLIIKANMPDLDGLTVTATLKAQRETRSIDVVLLTAGPLTSLRNKAFPLGAKAVERTPVSPAEVAQLASR